MKVFSRFLVFALAVFMIGLCACSGNAENSPDDSGTPVPTSSTSEPSATPANPGASQTALPGTSQEPSPEPSPSPAAEQGISKVVLVNDANSTGNNHFTAAHYGLHSAYTGEYVVFINYMTLLRHGGDHSLAPEAVEGFQYQGEGLLFHDGLLYFMIYDFNVGEYYLYSYDFENEPVKVMDSTVYYYEFINGKLYFTKQFVQGPIFSYDMASGEERQVTKYRAHDFTSDGNDIYFYATDAGTAPGLVKYDLSTNVESTLVFPFFSHNYLVHGNYIYYVNENSATRSIHRMSMSDQSILDIEADIYENTISLNISDGILYILTENGIKSCGLDGNGMTAIYESEDYLSRGLHIFGDRIYFTDGSYLYMIKKDGTDPVYFPLF
ncbi:MAG: DUF5050 domain-containing protein [Clostridia bacterium]|nr:DUF5050 domain-containing protein [Clostridia bacterium]